MNNPWFNPEALNSYFDKRPKKVRITTTEILADTPQLPNYRKNRPPAKIQTMFIAQKERLQLLILRPVCRHLHSIGFPKTELLPESERRIMTKFI